MKLRVKGSKTGNYILLYETNLTGSQKQKVRDLPQHFWITIDTDTIEKREKQR